MMNTKCSKSTIPEPDHPAPPSQWGWSAWMAFAEHTIASASFQAIQQWFQSWRQPKMQQCRWSNGMVCPYTALGNQAVTTPIGK